MNKTEFHCCCAALLAAILSLTLVPGAQAQQRICIDRGWQFCYGDGSRALADPAVSDSWRVLDLPHDWSVETEAAAAAGGTVVGPFSTNSTGRFQTGFTVGGEGWYKKDIVIASEGGDNRYTLYFEGAYNQAEVYVNGRKLYFNHYGYISFRVDITEALHSGTNTLLVRVTNEGNNTRWYAGSGIFRHVWLLCKPAVHSDEWDTYVQLRDESLEVDGGTADSRLSVQTQVYNDGRYNAQCSVCVDILDAQGESVATGQTSLSLAAGTAQPVSLDMIIHNAHLWSTDTPYMYTARIRVSDGSTTDSLTRRFGVRTLHYSATEGLKLNAQPILLRGGCVHHDNGLLGAAAHDRAEQRKLELLKAQGYNAVRTSHGMPAEHFLDVCDSLGILVVDETFDQWLVAKNAEDYHRYFAEHSDRDLQTMIRRDRNHPSIIMWSIGNEIPGRIEPTGMAVAERLRNTIRQLDTSRPITAAICGWDQGDAWNVAGGKWEELDDKAFRSLDIGGYNYMYGVYEHDHQTHPDRVMVGLESYPKQMSQNWDLVEQKPYVVGDFIWTAMDYLGEAGIGSASIRTEGQQSMFQDWPWYNGWCGDIDLIGQKKPQSYYHDVVWRRSPITMAVERPVPEVSHQSISAYGWQLEQLSWTFPELEEEALMTVNVYSRSPRVRLYLNGQAVADKPTSDTYYAGFAVPYQPGTLRAVNLDADGRELQGEAFELQTTSAPAALRLTADRQSICNDACDLAYVTVELVDAEGRVVTSNSDIKVALSVEGEGQLMAAGNASPTDMESFRSTTPRLYQGRVLAILRSTTTAGTIRLNAQAEGLPAASIVITTGGN